MHSRAIVILSLFALACVIVAGSLAIRFTTASASVDRSTTSVRAERADGSRGNDRRLRPADLASSGGEPMNAESLPDDRDLRATRAASAELSARERASADTLEAMLGRVHRLFGNAGSVVSDDMIPHLAEMITVINQYDHLVYRVEIVERDVVLAEERARTLNDVLRLNVLEPSQLQIIGRAGLPASRVDVGPIDVGPI